MITTVRIYHEYKLLFSMFYTFMSYYGHGSTCGYFIGNNGRFLASRYCKMYEIISYFNCNAIHWCSQTSIYVTYIHNYEIIDKCTYGLTQHHTTQHNTTQRNTERMDIAGRHSETQHTGHTQPGSQPDRYTHGHNKQDTHTQRQPKQQRHRHTRRRTGTQRGQTDS